MIYYRLAHSDAYRRVAAKLTAGECVVVDGGVASELEQVRADRERTRAQPWGFWALHEAQEEVRTVHRRYVEAGCDVLSTNTWSVLEAWSASSPAWELSVTGALRLARSAVADAGAETAVAFCINGDIADQRSVGALELLTWKWLDEPPDLVIFETLPRLPGPELLAAVQMVVALGLPVWVSLRRVAGGMAEPGGTRVDGPDPLREAVAVLESTGVSALLLNCVPMDAIGAALAELAGSTELPLGCCPNLGHGHAGAWRPGAEVTPERYADEALGWFEAGARIIGGCCGVRPAHVQAVAEQVRCASAWSSRGV